MTFHNCFNTVKTHTTLLTWHCIPSADFLMAYSLMIFDAYRLPGGPYYVDDPLFKTREQHPLEKLYVMGLVLQVCFL